ncbi:MULTISPECIES: hypothetical protein [unclassified Mesorhizobium]|uniref:hypothetical protein n=1 Tax=unclassified Mesorhizobium TaxID=325217 RepID=UPI001129A27B|nr:MULTISPECIES: hypothetical protein [unclassified Mesorhizobium]TPJ31089.1 hypothetical protein FJ418_22005 [Mesorhizobium sp. B2-8-3]UCI28009.1 hypothetical protein FJ430_10570 [Mesorhizobium sp. B2-8-5]
MRLLRFFYATALVLGSLNSAVIAKTCKCDQHEAEAAGAGSCSRSESADYCTINFPASDASGDFADPSKWQAAGYKIDFASPKTAFSALEAWSKEPVTASVLATVAATAVPPERFKELADKFGAIFTNSLFLEGMVQNFNKEGCVDAELNDFHIMIIAQSSSKNGTCK